MPTLSQPRKSNTLGNLLLLRKIVTPFAVVKAHPNLAAHVQNIGSDSLLDGLVPDFSSTPRYTRDPQGSD